MRCSIVGTQDVRRLWKGSSIVKDLQTTTRTISQYVSNETGRVIAVLVAAQIVCLAIGCGLHLMWGWSPFLAVILGTGLLTGVTYQGVALWRNFGRRQAIAQKLRLEADARAERERVDLVCTQQAVIFGLAHLAECRDPATGST
jgi:low affinity Fe/Cu permease